MSPTEQFADVAKAAPPITVTGMTLAGYPLSQWVLVATFIYTVIQIGITVYRFEHWRKAKQETGAPGKCAIANCPARKP